jgi:hypothetical protein
VRALPFISGLGQPDQETQQMEAAQLLQRPDSFAARWRPWPTSGILRTFSPNRDVWNAGPVRLSIHAPLAKLADPDGMGWEDCRDHFIPALWIEVELDNTDDSREGMLFLGLHLFGHERMRPLHWGNPDLCGVGLQDRWCLAAEHVPGRQFTIRDGSVAGAVEEGAPVARMAGNQGGIFLRVAPRSRGRLLAVLAWGHQGWATQGVRSRYLFQRWWELPEEAAAHALSVATAAIDRSAEDDAYWAGLHVPAERLTLLAQSAQAYQANSSLLDGQDGIIRYNVSEGAYLWRNTLDLAADQLPWELARIPWAAKRIAEDHLRRNAYTDTLRLPGENAFTHPGGLVFAHDQGNHTAYCPPGGSAYERSEVAGCYSFMSMEQVLNAAYLFAGCSLQDPAWGATHQDVLRRLVESIERRDHPDPGRRDGIPKAESDRVGAQGAEITTYDALDHALMRASGSAYLAVKSWGACAMLAKALETIGDIAAAGKASSQARRIRSLLLACSHPGDPDLIPANFLDAIPHAVPAILDGLAVPAWLGIIPDPVLQERLVRHWLACLRHEGLHACGGLRLSAGSDHTWPSKTLVVAAAVEMALGRRVSEDAPRLWPELSRWCQDLAAATTISDQIRLDLDKAIGAFYYPRIVSALMCVDVFGRIGDRG